MRIASILAVVTLVLAAATMQRAQAETVALYYDGSYVDVGASTSNEATQMRDALIGLGHTVNTFTGTTAADFSAGLAGAQALVIPELERGDLVAAMAPDAEAVVRDFVQAGGCMAVGGGYTMSTDRNAALLNVIFGYSLTESSKAFSGETLTKTAAAAGTPFASAPATLSGYNGTVLLTTSLPAGFVNIYEYQSQAIVVTGPEGNGRVTHLGYDWFNAVGQDVAGDWNTVLDLAVKCNTPPVITLLGDNPLILDAPATYIEPGATATDAQDGDLTGSIVITGSVGSLPGVYVRTYTVTDSGGLSDTEQRQVIVRRNCFAVTGDVNTKIDCLRVHSIPLHISRVKFGFLNEGHCKASVQLRAKAGVPLEPMPKKIRSVRPGNSRTCTWVRYRSCWNMVVCESLWEYFADEKIDIGGKKVWRKFGWVDRSRTETAPDLTKHLCPIIVDVSPVEGDPSKTCVTFGFRSRKLPYCVKAGSSIVIRERGRRVSVERNIFDDFRDPSGQTHKVVIPSDGSATFCIAGKCITALGIPHDRG